jgi:hypothetical protein
MTVRNTNALIPDYKYLGDTKLCLYLILEIGYRKNE